MRVLAAFLLALLPAAALAQHPVVEGDDGSLAVATARALLERGTYVRIDRDTVLGADFRARDLVIDRAEVRLEGEVEGSIAVLGGHLWLRPGSRVGGSVAVLGGGVYPSARARVERDSILHLRPGAGARTELPAEGGARVVSVTPPPRAPLVSPLLAALPTYDRVSGLTLHAGVGVRPTRAEAGAWVAAWGSFRTRQEERLGGGIRWRLPVAGAGVHLTGELSRATRTNDAWIHGPVANSVRAATLGSDYRDYWDADLLRVGVERAPGPPLVPGESRIGSRIALQASRDRSLPVRATWAITGRRGLERENPPVAEGTLVSLLAGTEVEWRAPTSRFRGVVEVEHALSAPGDARFTRAEAVGSYRARALASHELRVSFRAMSPFPGTDAPPQRFGILGGSGTLPSEPIARYRGDRLVFVESAYRVPVPRVRVRYLGSPSVEAVHKVGAAWTRGDASAWTQNAGAGVVFAFLSARALLDPSERPLRPHFSLGLSVPQR